MLAQSQACHTRVTCARVTRQPQQLRVKDTTKKFHGQQTLHRRTWAPFPLPGSGWYTMAFTCVELLALAGAHEYVALKPNAYFVPATSWAQQHAPACISA